MWDSHLSAIRSGGRAQPSRAYSRESGAAVPEFILVMLIFIPLVLGIFQFGLYLHMRNTLTACAHEGAREAANLNRNPTHGVQYAEQCAAGALNPNLIRSVTPGWDNAAGQPLVVIEVRATMPALGLFGGITDFTVTGHAVEETL